MWIEHIVGYLFPSLSLSAIKDSVEGGKQGSVNAHYRMHIPASPSRILKEEYFPLPAFYHQHSMTPGITFNHSGVLFGGIPC